MLSFEDSCFEAAKRFVQTALVIDDEARYIDDKSDKSNSESIITPATGLTPAAGSERMELVESSLMDESEVDHDLNIEAVVNGFAQLNITCSVQCPKFGLEQQQDEKYKKWALDCIEHTDISIIDWRLLKENRHLASDIIIDLLKRDKDIGGRIRLLCIYTAQPHPKNILGDLKNRILDELNLSVSGRKEDFAYIVDEKVRIVIFSKSSTMSSFSDSKVVSFEELPGTLLREFSVLVDGLVPCAALHSIAVVREQTYSLLALMNKNLDGAFCAHRALILDTDDSIDYILYLISQEISTKILCDESARSFLDTASIKSWFDGHALPQNQYDLERETLWEYLKNGGANLSDVRKQRAKTWLEKKQESQAKLQNSSGEEISFADAEGFIEKGLFQEIKGCVPPSEKKLDKFAELFYPKKEESEIACNEFSRLSCTSKDGSALRKSTNDGLFLTLGSVLKVSNDDSEYWLCLQPPCDSVRLNEKTEMLFFS